MDRIEWDTSFSIGIDSIDHQHKKLFELVNLFLEAMEVSKDNQFSQDILQGLMTYLKAHFAAEENEMQEMDYPLLAEHRLQHQQLRQRVEERMERWTAGHLVDLTAVAELLKNWLTQHIRIEDKQIGIWIEQQQPVHN